MLELQATATMMCSPDFKERFRAEYLQLKIRYQKLAQMIKDWDGGVLGFEPTCPRATFNFQLRAMRDYLDILEVRAKMEDISLEV